MDVISNSPMDVVAEIFKYCDLEDLGRSEQVCRLWNKLLNEDNIWNQVAPPSWVKHFHEKNTRELIKNNITSVDEVIDFMCTLRHGNFPNFRISSNQDKSVKIKNWYVKVIFNTDGIIEKYTRTYIDIGYSKSYNIISPSAIVSTKKIQEEISIRRKKNEITSLKIVAGIIVVGILCIILPDWLKKS
jgi:hypothetical protein